VFIAERLYCESRLFLFWSQLKPDVPSVPLSGSTSRIVGRRRVQNSIYENFAGLISKVQDVEILDCGSGGFLRTGDNEFRDGGSTQRGCTLNKTLLDRSEPGLQALLFSRAPFLALDPWHNDLPRPFRSVRLIGVQVKTKIWRLAARFSTAPQLFFKGSFVVISIALTRTSIHPWDEHREDHERNIQGTLMQHSPTSMNLRAVVAADRFSGIPSNQFQAYHSLAWSLHRVAAQT
jgi:hypothetical protein